MSGEPVQELLVFICGDLAGRLNQRSDNGQLSFRYASEYKGCPLSLSMPVTNTTYGDKVVRPYLFGLLPDNHDVRKQLGREIGASADNPFALLAVMGLDCPGAVQICSPNDARKIDTAQKGYVSVSEDEIGKRLARLRGNGEDSWQAPGEHWSLGGNQGKIALARFGGQWYSCEGAAATTHIVKPGIRGMRLEALDEHVCLRLAARCGIQAADSEYHDFEGQSAIVVRRYDRVVLEPFVVQRLHQEDFCQALSVSPDHKYTNEGGPSAQDIGRLLDRYREPQRNKELFTAQLFYNYLIGAPDAHAKNYSVLLGPSSEQYPLFAPLYDVASGFPYNLGVNDQRNPMKAAMSIGGENRVGKIGKRKIQKFADAMGLDHERVLDLMGNLADAVMKELPLVAEEVETIPGANELMAKLSLPVRSLCEHTLQRLE